MSANNGGAAFPGEKNERFGQPNDCNEGMTLRDYFAAKALQAIIAADGTVQYANRAKEAYEAADAMLKARGEA